MMTVDSSCVATVFPQQSPEELMAYETWRLKSFDDWPCEAYDKARPMALAKDGFYYTGTEDIVKCFSCGAQKGQWAFRSKPNVEHQRLNPECQHLRGQDARNISVYLPDPETRQAILTNLHERYCSGDSSHSNSISQTETISFRTNSNMDRPTNISSQNTVASQSSLLVSQLPTSSSFNSDVINRSDSTGRRPVTQLSVPLREDKVILLSEMARLQTFKDSWPYCSPSPNDLAKAGFSFTGSPDRVRCVFCNGILKNWQDVDIPMIEHRKHFPNCPFVCGHQVGNIPLDVRSAVSISYNERMDATHSHGTGATNQFAPVSGIHTERPCHPNYATEASRIASYTLWPSGLSQTPQQLAEAGFFYAGSGDGVTCFHCGGGLRTWVRGEDPWEEHAKWFSRCPYLLQVKDEAFVQQFHYPNNLSEGDDIAGGLSEGDNIAGGSLVAVSLCDGERPRHTNYGTGVTRIASSTLRPSGASQTPQQMFPRRPYCLPRVTVEASVQRFHNLNNLSEGDDIAGGSTVAVSLCDGNIEINRSSDRDQIHLISEEYDEGMEVRDRETHERLCISCRNSPPQVQFLRCGHVICCSTCSEKFRQCPVCRMIVRVRLHL